MKVNKERLLQVINEKWSNKQCPMCGKNNWTFNGDIFTMLEVTENKMLNLGGKMLPLTPMVCNECGNTILINPLTINCAEE